MNLQKSILRGIMTLTVFAVCLIPVFKAGAFVENTYNVAAGSRFAIFSTQAGKDAFSGKPSVYIEFASDDASHARSVKVVGPDNYPSAGIICEWTSSKTLPGTYKLWVLPASDGQTGKPVLVSEFFTVQGPAITGVQRDSSDFNKIIVTGRYFGVREPLIWLTYPHPDDENMLERIVCQISTPLAFPDGENREGESCMAVQSGESRVSFILPQGLPHGADLTFHLQNKTGGASAVIKKNERDDVVLEIEASPENGGATNPEGSIIVNLNEPVEIGALPNQGFRFVHWKVEGNIEILNSNLLSAVVLPKENGTVTAVFEPVDIAFGGIVSAGAAIIADPDTGSNVSRASLTWETAYSASTPGSHIKYHIYVGETDDINVLYREANRVDTVTGATEAFVPLDPVPGAVYYVLAVAEDDLENRNGNHRPVRVENEEITFRKRIKDVAKIVSAKSELSLSEDEKILTIKNGDYWSSFAEDDIVLFNAYGKQFMDKINLVYLDGGDTILWVEPAAFEDVIQFGEWNAESYTPDTQDSWSRKDRGFTKTIHFGQGVTAYGRIILKGLTLGIKTKFSQGSKNIVQARLKGTIGFYGRLQLNMKAGASNNPGESKQFLSGEFTSYLILDGKKLKCKNNLIVDLFLDFRTEKKVKLFQSINIKKRFDVLIEIHSDETYKITDNSADLVFDSHCTTNNFTDMDIYFNIKPILVSSLLDKNPDYARLSLGIEEKIRELDAGFVGFRQFDITAGGTSGYSYSAKSFWFPAQYHTKNFSGKPMEVFSLPVVDLTGPNRMDSDTTETFVMFWKDGINNKVYEPQVIWDFYHSNGSASYKATAGPVIKTEEGYKRTLYFTPHTPGRWTITMSAKGNGVLSGESGVVFDSVSVYAYEPEE